MKTNTLKYILLLLSFLFLTSCGVWTNFTTYFNRYYNANKLFQEIQEEVTKNNPDIFQFKQKKISGSLKNKLKKLIEKTSNILQFNRESSYFDDALLMTGKAFYFQGDFSKALRKFQELDALNDENLALEDKLWIGKSYLQLREFDKGIEVLNNLIEQAADDEDILEKAMVAEISFYTYREKYPEAIDKCNQLLKVSNDDILNAKAAYQLGELNLKLQNLKEAANAFAKVENFSPDFTTEFNSKLAIAKIYKDLGKYEESMNLLDSLKNENKFNDYWDTIELEIGKIYYEKGNVEDALAEYTRIDTLYKGKESSGIASFLIGKVLVDNYHDYDSAVTYFKKAISSKAPNEYKDEALKETQRLVKYTKLSNKLKHTFKLLSYLQDDNNFIRDSLAYEDLIKKDSTNFTDNKKVTTKEEVVQNVGFKKKNSNFLKKKKPVKPKRPTVSEDSLKSIISNTEYELANIFFTELNVPDSAYYYYNQSLRYNPNSSEKPQILYAIGNYYLLKGDTLKADSILQNIYENYKGNEIVNEVAKILKLPEVQSQTNAAELLYEKAEDSLDDSNYTSAVKILSKISKDYPKSTFAAKSLYALGWIYENQLFKPDSAEMYYDSLSIKYKNSKYAHKVKSKLYFYKKEQAQKQAAKDSTKLAAQKIQTGASQVQDSVKTGLNKSKIPPETKIKDKPKK